MTERAIVGSRWLLGRGAVVDIRLDEERVSECHAELTHGPFGFWWIHDRDSAGGTFINGRRVRSHILSAGDSIGIGAFVLRLRLADEPRSESVSEPAPVPPLAVDLSCDDALVRLDGATTQVGPWAGSGAMPFDDALDLAHRLGFIPQRRARQRELCRWLVDRLGATRALVLRLRGDATTEILCAADPSGRASVRLSRRLLTALWRRRRLLTATDTRGPSPRLSVACPLSSEADGPLDALYIEADARCSAAEWRGLVAVLASTYRHAEPAWRRRSHERATAAVEHELETARALQQRLMQQDQSFDGLEVVTGFEPCLWVGGDYVDAVALPDRRVMLVIADVCGKGLQGAMVAASLHTLVRATVESGEPLHSLLERMNRYLCSYLPDDSYVTLAAVAIDPRSGALEHANAGHPPVLAVGPGGRLRSFESGTSSALGMWEGDVEVQPGRLARGELLVMYTDGLAVALSGDHEPLPEGLRDRLSAIVAEARSDPLGHLAGAFRRALGGHRGASVARDDAAFLIARRVPSCSVGGRS